MSSTSGITEALQLLSITTEDLEAGVKILSERLSPVLLSEVAVQVPGSQPPAKDSVTREASPVVQALHDIIKTLESLTGTINNARARLDV